MLADLAVSSACDIVGRAKHISDPMSRVANYVG
jgi:hypothetical protein